MKIRVALPLILFILIVAILWKGLSLHPSEVPSPLVGKPIPTFALPTIADSKKMMSNKDFLGQVTLLNIWATWCYACANEHELLLQIAAEEPHLVLYGLNYKDNAEKANVWLNDHGNPYDMVASDPAGTAAIDWGVYGTPETFIVDKQGIIRYKQIGSLTQDVWQNKIKPLVRQLESETT